MIETASDFFNARRKMGLSLCEMADLLRLGGDSKRGADYVHKLETGKRAISGPIAAHMEALLDGWRPSTGKAEP